MEVWVLCYNDYEDNTNDVFLYSSKEKAKKEFDKWVQAYCKAWNIECLNYDWIECNEHSFTDSNKQVSFYFFKEVVDGENKNNN